MPAAPKGKPEIIKQRASRRHAIVPDEVIVVVSYTGTPPFDLYDPVLQYIAKQHLSVAGRLTRFRESRSRQFPITNLGATHREILFYKVAALSKPDDETTELTRIKPLQDYIEALNTWIAQGADQTISGMAKGKAVQTNVRFEIVTPNIYAAASDDGGDSGSPAAPPEPVPYESAPPSWQFRFEDPFACIVEAAKSHQHLGRLAIIVLDTCPDPGALAAKTYGNNPLFDAIHGRVLLPGASAQSAVTLTPYPNAADAFADMVGAIPDWPGYKGAFFDPPEGDQVERKLDYGIANHGIFIAGMLRSILPNADIRVIQMLDDTGVAALDHVFFALTKVRDAAIHEEKSVVVNMSWTTSTLIGGYGWAQSVYDRVFALFMESMMQMRVLCVAAAGNNNLTSVALGRTDTGSSTAGGQHDRSRYPARYANSSGQPIGFPNIIGVAAAKLGARAAAEYSNAAPERGVATIGGNARLVGHDAAHDVLGLSQMVHVEPMIEGEPPKWDGIAGIYGDDAIPFSNVPNKTGWVYWAGTSFATPIIAAIAASMWLATDLTAAPSDVISEIIARALGAGHPIPELATSAIYAEQH